LLKNLENKK